MTRYVILTDEAGPGGQTHRYGAPEHLLSEERPRACRPGLLTLDLDPNQLREVTRDLDVIALAPVMPTLLCPAPPPAEILSDTPPVGWGVQALNCRAQRQSETNIAVAVLDTGIDRTHPAFRGLTLNMHDFVGTGIADICGHGTHIAGTIFGRDVDGTPIGVAPTVSEGFVAKIFDDTGKGQSNHMFEALIWAADQAPILCMSMTFDVQRLSQSLRQEGMPPDLAYKTAISTSQANQTLLRRLVSMLQYVRQGILICMGNGNDCQRSQASTYELGPVTPMFCPGALSVGAIRYGSPVLLGTAFSNTGAALAAPGEQITSAAPGGGTNRRSGTSMAAAHVAGAAALWWHEQKEARSEDIAEQILMSCNRSALSQALGPFDFGAGLVQGPDALETARPKHLTDAKTEQWYA